MILESLFGIRQCFPSRTLFLTIMVYHGSAQRGLGGLPGLPSCKKGILSTAAIVGKRVPPCYIGVVM